MLAYRLIHQDAALVVVDKPPGLLTIPGNDLRFPHLRGLVERDFGPVRVVHRLDRLTSGLVVFARTAEAHRALNDQFARHAVEKTYLALVWGDPPWKAIEINTPLRENVGRRKRTMVDTARGKPSLTRVQVLRRGDGWTLLEITPRTGRRHQIRAHLYHIGFPIVGDPLYGVPPPRPAPIARLGLHATRLTFTHPLSGEPITVTAPQQLV